MQADVADGGSVRDGISSVGELDVVVNNAGIIGPIAQLANADETQWREAVLVNLLGPFHVAQAAMPLLIASGRGTLINISSGAATRPIPGWSAYCASKAGLSMLTLSIAMEYGAAGVRAFDLRPGPVDTPMRDAIRMMGRSRRTENRRTLTAPSAVAQAVSALLGGRRQISRPADTARGHPRGGGPGSRRHPDPAYAARPICRTLSPPEGCRVWPACATGALQSHRVTIGEAKAIVGQREMGMPANAVQVFTLKAAARTAAGLYCRCNLGAEPLDQGAGEDLGNL